VKTRSIIDMAHINAIEMRNIRMGTIENTTKTRK
jgi:hypothetical protein